MPIKEPITNTLIPKEAEKPIPVRIISTKSDPKIRQIEPNRDQPAINETKSAAESAAPAESVKLSPQLSALARKEQAHRQRELAFKEREKAFEARLAEAEKFEKLKAKLGSKDYSEIESLGLNYEDYTKYLLDKQNGENPEKQELKKLADEINALKKSTEENVTKQYDETVAEYKKEVNALADKDSRFSSVKELGRQDVALQYILDSWEEDEEEVTAEQALQIVEDYSVEEAKKFSAISKLKKAPEEGKKPLPKPGLKTLTQQVVASSEKKTAKSLQYLSESERYAEARRRVLERKSQGS